MDVLENNIDALIPQKQPFVMIDKLIYSDEKTTRCGFTIPSDNVLVEKGEFSVPGLVENIAQTAAARMGYLAKQKKIPVPLGFIGAIKNLEIFYLPKVNEELETEITIENQVFDVTIISGRIKCKNLLIAQCEMKIFIDVNKK